jgi:MFS family permease
VALPKKAAEPSAEPLTLGRIVRRHVEAYRSPSISAPGLGWLCYTLTYVALLTVLPEQLAAEDRIWAATWMPITGMAVSLTLGMALLSRIRAVPLAIAGFGGAACVTLVLMANPQSAWLAIVLMGVLGLVQGSGFAAVPQLNSEAQDQALANGAMAQMGNLGNTLGTPLLLVLLSVGGVPAIYFGLALCYVLGLLLHLWQAARRKRMV